MRPLENLFAANVCAIIVSKNKKKSSGVAIDKDFPIWGAIILINLISKIHKENSRKIIFN